jgi:diguanylate cyclase (GGDEF) domain
MSGDEFVAITVNKSSEEDAEKIIEHIESNFSKYNLSSKKTYKLSISIGYSIYRSNVVTSFDELIQNADNMLYDKKKIIKNSPHK